MKTIHVVAAIICDSLEEKTRILATERGYGEFKGWWEFPGGKVENRETEKQALFREIKEELDVEILIGEELEQVEYDYPSFHLKMKCFWCVVSKGRMDFKEASSFRWLKKEELYEVKWLPADISLIKEIEDCLL